MEAANKEYTEMHDNIKAELLVRSRRISDLWATNAMIRRTLVAAGVQIFGQFTGINGQYWTLKHPFSAVKTKRDLLTYYKCFINAIIKHK